MRSRSATSKNKTVLTAEGYDSDPFRSKQTKAAGALLGFLPYNFNPASIFLGDSGSLMIGFLLGTSSILLRQRSYTLLGMTAPVMALAIPLLDVILSVARRFLRGKPIFGADRGHIHHRLLDLGYSPRRAAFVLYGACFLATVFCVAQTMASHQVGVSVIVLFCVAAWLGIQSLGYAEFPLAARLMLSGTIQHSVDAHLNLRTAENSLRTAEFCRAMLDGAVRRLPRFRVYRSPAPGCGSGSAPTVRKSGP